MYHIIFGMFETFHKCILKFYLKIFGLIKYYCEEFQMTLKVVYPVFIMNAIRNTEKKKKKNTVFSVTIN